MYYLSKTFTFDAAHCLPGHEGKCHNLHGHTWQVLVTVASSTLQAEGPAAGMVQDFGNVKAAVAPTLALLDHHLLNEVPGLDNPTSENLARWLWERLLPELPLLHSIRVDESPGSWCTYRPNEG